MEHALTSEGDMMQCGFQAREENTVGGGVRGRINYLAIATNERRLKAHE